MLETMVHSGYFNLLSQVMEDGYAQPGLLSEPDTFKQCCAGDSGNGDYGLACPVFRDFDGLGSEFIRCGLQRRESARR